MTPEERRDYMRAYRAAHRDRINETRRDWRSRNPERNKEINRKAAAAFRMRQAKKHWKEMEEQA